MFPKARKYIVCVVLILPSGWLAGDDENFFKPKDKESAKSPAGKAEMLRYVPKKFATLQAVDVAKREVTLLADGEKEAKTWHLNPDAELKIHGWWGRLEQFQKGQRVWVWFQVDRNRTPKTVLMIADEVSEKDIHGTATNAEIDSLRVEQKRVLRERWIKEGLPGTVVFLHPLGGEMDFTLDHEAIRWGRSLKAGDKVKLLTEKPIEAEVKEVRPWRERTQLRLVMDGFAQTDLTLGQRLNLHVATPSDEVDAADVPPDIGRPRSKPERIEWFLASMYCSCKVKGDVCTGMFYTLASCNAYACGMPGEMRKRIGKMIDQSMSDQQIWDDLKKTEGPLMLKPHLLR